MIGKVQYTGLFLVLLAIIVLVVAGCSNEDTSLRPLIPGNDIDTLPPTPDPVWELHIQRVEDVLQGHYTSLYLYGDFLEQPSTKSL